MALVAADLLVFPLEASVADPDNKAYAALDRAGPGRVLELPVFERGTGQFGSVHLYYTLQAPRERPTGYSLAPRSTFRFTERFNRLDCGAWLPGDREELERLGIRYVVFHRRAVRAGERPGRLARVGGLESGLGSVSTRGGVITLFGRGEADDRAAAARARPLRAAPLRRLERQGASKAPRRRSGCTGGDPRLRLEPPVDPARGRLRRRRTSAGAGVRRPGPLTIPLTGEAGTRSSFKGPPGLGSTRRYFLRGEPALRSRRALLTVARAGAVG